MEFPIRMGETFRIELYGQMSLGHLFRKRKTEAPSEDDTLFDYSPRIADIKVHKRTGNIWLVAPQHPRRLLVFDGNLIEVPFQHRDIEQLLEPSCIAFGSDSFYVGQKIPQSLVEFSYDGKQQRLLEGFDEPKKIIGVAGAYYLMGAKGSPSSLFPADKHTLTRITTSKTTALDDIPVQLLDIAAKDGILYTLSIPRTASIWNINERANHDAPLLLEHYPNVRGFLLGCSSRMVAFSHNTVLVNAVCADTFDMPEAERPTDFMAYRIGDAEPRKMFRRWLNAYPATKMGATRIPQCLEPMCLDRDGRLAGVYSDKTHLYLARFTVHLPSNQSN